MAAANDRLNTAKTQTESYFASANTPDGFKNYFPELLSRADKLYIIKGGPGSGKSRLMREIANEAENRGFRTEQILCSSDINSLDGLIMTDHDGRVTAFADGTAPHTLEPKLPGAEDNIINMGDFWYADKLAAKKEEIRALNAKKSALYKTAYEYLGAAKKASDVAHSYASVAVDTEKLRAAVGRIFRGCRKGKSYSEQIRLISSIGMEGANMLDTLEHNETVYHIRDRIGEGHLFLEYILDAAKEYKKAVTLSISPLELTPDAVTVHGLSAGDTAFILRDPVFGVPPDDNSAKIINMERFYIDDELRANRQKYRFARRCRAELIEGALETFTEIKKTHFDLEDIYISAMDFKKKEDFTKKLLIGIFK